MRKFNHQLTGGIAVYRVNTDYYKNVGVGKQLVTALEADEGILGYSNYDRNQIFGSNPFYYAGKNLSNGVQPIQINKKTIPSTKLSDGNYLETSLTVMSDSAAEMTVKIGEDGYVPVEKIEIEPKDLTLEFGESIELKATITPENATYKGIEWSEKFFIPSFPKMVDKNGKVTVPKSMFASGILEVTAKSIDGEKSNTIKVKIISKKVTGISLAQENVTLNVDETQKLDYSIQPENAADKRVDWSSSNEEVVTVSKDGVITAKKQGNALVTATTTEGKKTATSKVSVVGRADAEGVFGTVPWSWEKESQTVTFKGGKFFDTDTYNSIYEKIEKLPELEGKKIKKIVFKEPIELSQNSSALFYWLGYLESIEGAHFLDTSKVVDMSLMFMNTLALTSLDIRNWDVSNVKVMNSMFYAAGAIEELDLNTWDVSNVEVMSSMFFNMRKLKKLNINNWDVRNVIEMSDAFNMTLSLPELNLSGWNTNKATGYIQEFTGTNDRLEKFVLGENCQLPIKYYYAGFPMDGGETYTGRWLKVSETGETIKVYETAKDLLDTYDCNGGIFIRERKE
ncbi:BspA family leucine-rich repeat surface protein [Candidatus Enterococcus mansonii]